MGPAKKIELMNLPGPTPAQWRLFLEVTLCGVSEARARKPLGHAAALCRPQQLPGVLECRHVSGLRVQPRTVPQPPQAARALPVRLRCLGGQCGATLENVWSRV